MANCVKNIRTKNYQSLIIGFQVTVENVRDVFLRHSVLTKRSWNEEASHQKSLTCFKQESVCRYSFYYFQVLGCF